MLNRVLIAGLISLIGSSTLALIYGWWFSNYSLKILFGFPGVVQVALITSLIYAILITPLTAWAYRPEKLIFFIILWIALALFILFINPIFNSFQIYSPLVLGVIGVTIIGFIK